MGWWISSCGALCERLHWQAPPGGRRRPSPPSHPSNPPPFSKVVSQVEVDLLNILSGGAPAGFEYHDVEEEYVVDAKTGVGSWQTAKPSKDTDKDKGDGGDSAPPTAEKPEKEKGAKRSRSKAAAKAAAAAAAAAEAEVEAEAAAA
eukprot:216877-Chlamydomonas_euryale.AAC.1